MFTVARLFYGCDVTSKWNARWCYVHGGKTHHGCDVASNWNARWCYVHGGKTYCGCDVTSNWNARWCYVHGGKTLLQARCDFKLESQVVLCSRWQDSSRV